MSRDYEGEGIPCYEQAEFQLHSIFVLFSVVPDLLKCQVGHEQASWKNMIRISLPAS